MRSFVVVVTLAGTLLGAAFLPVRRAAPAATSIPDLVPPRLIVLVTIDALRADHLGVYGYTRPTSPNIDAFARDAIVIEEAIAHAPSTKASIASLMTGLYPSAHKTYTTAYTVDEAMRGSVEGTPPKTDVLPGAVTTMAEAFAAAGYATAAITTNPFLIADFGFAQGFKQFEFMGAEDFATAEHVFSRALELVDRGPSPMFLWVHVMEPHSPYTPPESARRELPPIEPPSIVPLAVEIPPWIVVGENRNLRLYESLYDGEIRSADAAFGRFVTALRARGRWQKTALVLTADHGEQFMEHGGFEHNTNLHDELVHVPLIMHVPGLYPHFVQGQAQLIDVMPTLVALAGGPVPPTINGRNLGPMLRGEPIREDPAFAEIVGQQSMVRTREWKLITTRLGTELYALARDPGERHPMAYPKRTAELAQLLERIRMSALRAGEGIAGDTAPIGPGTRRRLEALGYIQP
jgi:arylsulfatase A-like enzyme